MSTERIDHVAEAVSWLEYSADQNPGLDDGRAMHIAAIALLHATLALVEQRRIANILFIARESHADIMEGLDALGVTADELKVGLGL